jgi:gamma-glutamylcyclotransferase (GGCT)/AIG2-like uncharacterized protein YtfP
MTNTSTQRELIRDNTNQTMIFVYGSLKRGYALHHLLTDQHYVGTAVTKPLYRLFDLGSYPGMIEWPEGLSVHGEIYKVNHSCLQTLDDAEGTAEGLYARRPVLLHSPFEAETVFAWFWLHSVAGKTDCRSVWPRLA